MFWHQYILIGLCISILSEFLIVGTCVRKMHKLYDTFLIVLLVHCFSHPTATLIHYFIGLNFWVTESYVVLVETVLYRKAFGASFRLAFCVSLLANGGSVIAGAAFRAIFL